MQSKIKKTPQVSKSQKRQKLFSLTLIIMCTVLILRLFMLQIVKYDFYRQKANQEHFKKYTLPTARGSIYIANGDDTLPLVLNDKMYLIYADPAYIKNIDEVVGKVNGELKLDEKELRQKLQADSRYQILAKKVDKATKDKLLGLKIPGIGATAINVRSYPQGEMAAKVIGFVNDDEEGQYGIEGYLNDQLKGQEGELNAVTDRNGIPLETNDNNIRKPAIPGSDVYLTIDAAAQRLVEDALKAGFEKSKPKSAHAVVLDANTGAVKAMASYPSYNPLNYQTVSSADIFRNDVISTPIEPGSICKTFTMGAALNEGSFGLESTYFDADYVVVEDMKVTNAIKWGAATRSATDILQKSLNTGAIYLLKTLGGGEINAQAREKLYDYLSNHYQLGKKTNIELQGEAQGIIPKPDEGFGLDVQYANMAFGQGMTMTLLQSAASVNSMINGGTYYAPYIVDHIKSADGQVIKKQSSNVVPNVLTKQASADLRELMYRAMQINNKTVIHGGYKTGGKTGTAQIPTPTGGYYTDRYNGTYVGFIGNENPIYTVAVWVEEPTIPGFAGTVGAGPVFNQIINGLLNNIGIPPIVVQ